jgi:hypothetical protein
LLKLLVLRPDLFDPGAEIGELLLQGVQARLDIRSVDIALLPGDAVAPAGPKGY